MINPKQTERMIAKVARLERVYAPFLTESRTALPVTQVTEKGERTVLSGDTWGAPFEYAVFRFRMPAHDQNVYLECDDGGVENLIYVNGVPRGMTDWVRNAQEEEFRPHRFLPFGDVREGDEVRIEAYASHPIAGTMPYESPHTFSLKSLEGERTFRGIYLVRMREQLKRFSENLKFLGGLFRTAEEGDPQKEALYRLYEELYRALSMAQEPPDEQLLAEINERIEESFSHILPREQSPYVGIVGHSHLDTAWLWTVEETRKKALRTVSNAVTLLKRYPDYTFFFSTALYLDWIKHDSPELFDEIKALVREGRFEPGGATWVECDCNLIGSEALVRQFVRGKRFLREELGYDAKVFWLPDTFGYSAALPQIMRQAGIEFFLTTKLSWNDTNEFPYDAFRWQGIDGSSVLVHFNSTQTPANPEAVAARLNNRKEKHLNDGALLAYGYGDGGGGPSDDMVREALRTCRHYPRARVAHTTVTAFMERLSEKQLPKYCGELYLELHRGTLSMYHEIKRNNRLLEIALHDAEFVSVAADKREWKQTTDECYDTLMLNQFHDILPGTCIHEVNETALRQNTAAIARLGELIGGKGDYWNTLGFEREETLEWDDGQQTYSDFDGNRHTLARFAFPAFGRGRKIAAEGTLTYRDGVVETAFYRAVVKDGAISSLTVDGREIACGLLGELKFCEHIPYQWDNWDIDADYRLQERPVQFLSEELVSNGPLELRIRSRYRFGKSVMTRDLVFNPFDPMIRFENKVDFREDHGLLRVYFPTDLIAPTYKSQIQFGHIERSVYRNTSEEQAMFEACNHKWSDLSETHLGVALFNDCKYGVACEEGTLSLTLAKSGSHPDETGGKGILEFSYALCPHRGSFSAENVVRPAEAMNIRPVRTPYELNSPLVGISQSGILCETVKFADRGEGIVLRLYECERSHTSTVLTFRRSYRFFGCDLFEKETETLGEGEKLRLEFRPFEIKTIKLR